MIVDKERKVIYLHNPKCGGTFLRDLYIEKYGESEATKWWGLYTLKYGTDLGHITYADLPRFIPEWREFRIVVMIRNPYNRFYSAVKETQNQFKKVSVGTIFGFTVRLPAYFCGDVIQAGNKIRKIFKILRIYTGIYPQVLPEPEEPDKFCKRINSLKQSKQDKYIRSKRIPWLNPQSYYTGKDVEIFRYELENDWKKLLEIFDLKEYQNRLSIAKDYDIPDNICELIESIYPEDHEIFEMYRKKSQ